MLSRAFSNTLLRTRPFLPSSPSLSPSPSTPSPSLFPSLCRSLTLSLKPLENQTPQHFGESGVLLMEDGKTFLTLSKSLLHVGEVGGTFEEPEVKFEREAKVHPTLNPNARLHLLEDKNLYAFGGSTFFKNNLHLFHLETPEGGANSEGEWKMTEKSRMDTQLQHFFQTTIGNHLYVLGESYYDEINDFPCSLYVYNTHQDTWETPSFEGEPPSERKNLLFFSRGKNLLVLSPNLFSSYDLYVFDTETKTWTTQPLDVEDGASLPYSRGSTTLTVLGNKAVIFGGIQLGSFLDDVHVLDLDTFLWKKVDWEGERPTARTGHCALGVSDSRMLVFGGGTNAFFQDNSMFVLDILDK